jgi:uncharacterized protein (TIGR02145 family)
LTFYLTLILTNTNNKQGGRMAVSVSGRITRLAAAVAVSAVVLTGCGGKGAKDGAGVVTGTFTDSRDGKAYKTVTIGRQVWMAENLNYEAQESVCYDNKPENCEKYGRLYNWDTAEQACPAGYHLPTNKEWSALVDYAGGERAAGTKLKPSTGWKSYSYGEGVPAGTNDYGFSALPGGCRNSDGRFGTGSGDGTDANENGYWWSATEGLDGDAWYMSMWYGHELVNMNVDKKTRMVSVRCVRDAPDTAVSAPETAAAPPAKASDRRLKFGTYTDSRDGQTYKTVTEYSPHTSGGGYYYYRTYMTENLNYAGKGGACYENKEENCAKYGRLYDVKTATRACPAGSDLPRDGIDFVDGGYDEAADFGYYTRMTETDEELIWYRGTVYGYRKNLGENYGQFSLRCVWEGRAIFQFTDSRDGQTYGKVSIGGRTWMADNLNYAAEGSKCYENNAENCDKYGRLYDWKTATRACPAGWRLPGDDDWDDLASSAVGGTMSSEPGTNLKSPMLWKNVKSVPDGWDYYGFSALPGGAGLSDGSFAKAGKMGLWWSATEYYDDKEANGRMMNNYQEFLDTGHEDKKSLFSVRCVQERNDSVAAPVKPDTGSFKDSRDGKTYKNVAIGGKTWMAENLNFAAKGGVCYDNKPGNCEKYGRLYNWETAKTVCPAGYHLPSDDEWTILTDAVGGTKIASKKLKSSSGWDEGGNGTDEYLFSGLSGGYSGSRGDKFEYVGNIGVWWSATEGTDGDAGLAWVRIMNYTLDNVIRSANELTDLNSVRCVAD